MLTSAKYLYLSTLVFLLFVIGIILSIPEELSKSLLSESGPIEIIAAVSYLLVLAYVFKKFTIAYIAKYHYFLMILFMFTLRELDFDKRFTEVGILKSKFLISEQVPVLQKIIGGLVLLILIYAVARTLYHHAMPLLKSVLKPEAYIIGIYLGVGCIVVSKTLDGLERKLKGFGFEISNWFTQHASHIEEVLEMFIAVFFFIAFKLYAEHPDSNKWLRAKSASTPTSTS